MRALPPQWKKGAPNDLADQAFRLCDSCSAYSGHWHNTEIGAMARLRCALTLLRCWPSTVFWRLVPISGQPCQEKAASSLLTRLEPISQPSILTRQLLLSTRF